MTTPEITPCESAKNYRSTGLRSLTLKRIEYFLYAIHTHLIWLAMCLGWCTVFSLLGGTVLHWLRGNLPVLVLSVSEINLAKRRMDNSHLIGNSASGIRADLEK